MEAMLPFEMKWNHRVVNTLIQAARGEKTKQWMGVWGCWNKEPQTGCLKQKFLPARFWRLQVCNQDIGRSMPPTPPHPWKAVGQRGTFFVPSNFCWLLVIWRIVLCNQDCREKYQQPQIYRWYHSNGRKRRRTKELIDEGKRRQWKSWPKLNIQKTKIMASGSITSCQIDGETMETVTDYIFLSSKITVDGDCNHEIKRCLLLGKKAMINLDSILKSRDITLPTKVRLVKTTVFPVVMYRYESWTIKKPEHWRIDAFELWC